MAGAEGWRATRRLLAVGLVTLSAHACNGGHAGKSDGKSDGSAQAGVDSGTDRAPDLGVALGTPGVWENVTSPEMPAALFTGTGGFGVGSIVADPARPSDFYVGGYGSIWRSTDYGRTWSNLNSQPNPHADVSKTNCSFGAERGTR